MYLSLDAYIADFSFTARIVNDLLGKRRDRNGLGSHGRRIRFRSVHFEQRGNQLRKPIDLAPHSADGGLGIRGVLHELES